MDAQPPPVPQTFRPSGAARTVAVVAAVLFAAVALGFCWLVPRGGTVAAAAVAAGVALALFLLVVRPTFVARLEFLPGSLRYTPGLGAPWEIVYADIRGFRGLRRREGTAFSIVPAAPGGRALTLPSSLGRPKELRAALAARLADLDAADLAEDLASLKADSDLGPDEPSRLAALARAKGLMRLAVWAMLAVVAASFYPPLLPYADWVLAAIPLCGLFLVAVSRGALTIGGAKQSARPDAAFLFLVPGIVLIIFDLRQWHVAAYSNLGVPWAAAALLVLGGSALAVRAVRKPSVATYIFMVIFTLGYSFGVVLLVNCGLDASDPQRSPAVVVGRRISHGKSTTYYVSITPWKGGRQSREIQVSGRFYNQHPQGTPVEVEMSAGLLAIPWFVLR